MITRINILGAKAKKKIMIESINMSRNSIRNIILVRYIKLKWAKPIARLNMYMVISTVDLIKIIGPIH